MWLVITKGQAMKYLLLLITLLSFFVGLGCSNNPNDLKEKRVVAVSNPQIPISRQTELTWYADFKIYTGTQIPTELQKSEKSEFTQLIKHKIEQEIIGKGFNFSLAPGLEETQYQVVALAVADDNFTSSEYLELFQLFPELSNDSDLKQGTLIVAIVDPIQRKAAWRGSIQLYLEPSLDKNIRKKRISTSVAKLLKSLKPND
jgi:hypothetical protein